MPKVMKTCRVCGKSYEACRTVNTALGVFRWQDVACSPECGTVYLEKLNESRGVHIANTEAPGEKPVEQPVAETVAEPVVEKDAESGKHSARKKKARNPGVVPLRLEANGEEADARQK